MNGASIRVGRIAGIGIYLHFTWLFIFILVTLSLYGHYSVTRPHWPGIEHWLFAIATSLLFFVSVLLHELAHSVVAQRKGIPVRSITLFIFGGVASIEREAERPGDEFSIAAAGPAMSLVLSLLFGLSARLTTGVNDYIATMSDWLSAINLGLAIFNMLPGFPMDGGRILRSILWWRSGNLVRATRAVGSISKAISLAFMLGGALLVVIGGEIFSGIWIAFIGMFLYNTAKGSVKQQEIHEVLQGLVAQNVMNTDCPQVEPYVNVQEFVEHYLFRTDKRCFLVVNEGRVQGIVTMQQIRQLPRDQWAATPLGGVMIPYQKLCYVAPDTAIEEVFHLMTQRNLFHALVVADGQILGIIARDNLLNFIETRLDLAA